MYPSIILSACLFGSVYIFAQSLKQINHNLLQKHKINHKLLVMNSCIFVLSGSVLFVFSKM